MTLQTLSLSLLLDLRPRDGLLNVLCKVALRHEEDDGAAWLNRLDLPLPLFDVVE